PDRGRDGGVRRDARRPRRGGTGDLPGRARPAARHEAVLHGPRPGLRLPDRLRHPGADQGVARGHRRLHRHRGGRPMSVPQPRAADGGTAREETVPLLELAGVRAGYGAIEVLHGVDLALRPGSLLALLGPNGGGKSTTMRVCAGLHPVTGGELRYAGRKVNGITAQDAARLGVCSIPEGRGVFPNLTVRENLWVATGTGARLEDLEEKA